MATYNKMSAASTTQIGNDNRANVLPVKPASGPGFLGPNYSPADEMMAPAQIGVRRGGGLDDVLGAVKGIIYYGDMIGFGEASSGFTKGMPGMKPLGVNYFINSGLQCSNGATMWEYVQTIPTGDALGNKIKDAIREVGLPQLRGMAPGILEDAKSALNPFPVINAVVGSGYPQCRLVKMPVGDADGKIQNVDGNLLVDPAGLLLDSSGKYYQEHWIQDREVPPVRRAGESADDQFMRGNPIQLPYDVWSAAKKLYRDDGCLVDRKAVPPGTIEPRFCAKQKGGSLITLGDGTQVMAYNEGFENRKKYGIAMKPTAIVSVSVAALSILALLAVLNLPNKRVF
jgi:hypothetical protein